MKRNTWIITGVVLAALTAGALPASATATKYCSCLKVNAIHQTLPRSDLANQAYI